MTGMLSGLIEALLDSSDKWAAEKEQRARDRVEAAKNARMVADARSGGEIKRTPPILPHETRFSHTHICAGTGHGKTQLLQKMILEDMHELKEGRGSVVVIDSQGDLINKIMHLYDVYELCDRLILIDPNNNEYPPALNLFDFGLHRLSSYSARNQEYLANGAIALYEYLFGALLGSPLTMRQAVMFNFLARLLMVIDGATIATMRGFVKEPDTVRPYLHLVEDITRCYFLTEFLSPDVRETREQVAARLWGAQAISSSLSRMFDNERNKLDLFNALNRGSLVLVNTAKSLLKQAGCALMGRFFIALIGQAIQEREMIREEHRRSTFIYVDEAHDYFDDNLEHMFNEFRKYRAGLIVAHQNLGQLSAKLRNTMAASTAVRMVGGLSESDTVSFARGMGCKPEFLMEQKKAKDWTNFAVWIKDHGACGSYKIPFGMLEARRKMTPEAYEEVVALNASRYSSRTPRERESQPKPRRDDLGEHELL